MTAFVTGVANVAVTAAIISWTLEVDTWRAVVLATYLILLIAMFTAASKRLIMKEVEDGRRSSRD